jgi:hypothetical protein
LISWGLRARKGNRHIIQLTYKYGGVRPLEPILIIQQL